MSVNKVILLGNLTSDPQVRVVGQSQVAAFGLATNERFKKADGTIVENTEFHNIELWGNAGVIQYLRKGTPVYIEGSIKTDKWQDQNGQNHSVTKIRAATLQLVGNKPQQAAPQQQYPPYPQYQQSAPPQGYPGAPQPGYQQSYGAVAQPQMPPQQQVPPMPQGAPFPPQQQAAPMPPATPPGQPSMAQQLDPNNYPGDLPFD